nr:GDP-fucose protein O-fucosyltransferase [Tanacetum cinerariifolium]
LVALDFITSIASDVFAMTDSGSQLSSLVSGYRVYYGGGKMPTIRPNKRRLADIFMKNNTIEWKLNESCTCVTLSITSKFWVPSGAMVNHGVFNSTATPLGGTTAHTYVSAVSATFFTVLTDCFPLSAEIVSEGMFRSDGAWNESAHCSPVAVLMISGSVFGNEHKKLM